MDILDWMSDFIVGDGFANSVSFAQLVVAIVALFWGGGAVKKWMKEFNERKLEATFGFYMNITCFIKRMRPLIFSDSGQPMKTLNLLSAEKRMRDQATKDICNLGEMLRSIASECLQYLSTKENQFPPSDSKEGRKEWGENLNKFVEILNQLNFIGTGIYIPKLESWEGIEKYCGEIDQVFKYFERTISQETEKIFDSGPQ